MKKLLIILLFLTACSETIKNCNPALVNTVFSKVYDDTDLWYVTIWPCGNPAKCSPMNIPQKDGEHYYLLIQRDNCKIERVEVDKATFDTWNIGQDW